MKSKMIGGVLLIVGTSIGGGMLALPLATAAGGYVDSTFLFLGAWLVTVIAAYFILEVNLWLPESTNLVSMAKATLGKYGQIVTWLSYLFLLYSLLAAYTAGGADLLLNLLKLANLSLPNWVNALIFSLILGAIIYCGVYVVDWANRGLMFVKLVAYVLLVALVLPHIQFANLISGRFRLLSGAVMVVATSFGYATIVPTLRTYFKSNVAALRLAIAIGSVIPLICYLIWDLAVQGAISAGGSDGLVAMSTSPHAVSDLTNALGTDLKSASIYQLSHLFTTLCITTSFLGVGLCLSDFLSDGLNIRKQGWGNGIVVGLTVFPPLALVLFYPNAFIVGLSYAGVFCVLLLMLIPCCMVWSGRYVKQIATGYRVTGGKVIILVEVVVAVLLALFGLFHIN